MMISMHSFVDEMMKISAPISMADAMKLMQKHWKYPAAAAAGATGLHGAGTAKRRYDIGKAYEEQTRRA